VGPAISVGLLSTGLFSSGMFTLPPPEGAPE
jgi:hypothetical protein